MKLAAVDIGSNAIRLQISSVLDHAPKALFKKIEYIRFPLRLGHDVFSTNKISPESVEKFKKLMKTFKLLLELYEVDDYMFCATSAMRESENGAALVADIKKELGIEINVIDGELEAEFIKRSLASMLDEKNYLHIDVGGGSTELNILTNGEKVSSQSFKVGSVRVLEHHDSPEIWNEMERWVKENTKQYKGTLTAIGTGGNIAKIFELSKKKPGQPLSLKMVMDILAMVDKISIEDRIYFLLMNPDRADVIVPAGKIYTNVMQWSGTKKILAPDKGLKDGILLHLVERNRSAIHYDF